MGRIAEITFCGGLFAAIVVEVGLVTLSYGLGVGVAVEIGCVSGSRLMKVGFDFLYRATCDCVFQVCLILVLFGKSMNFQCFVFAVIVALVFQRVLVLFGLFWLSLIAYLEDLL